MYSITDLRKETLIELDDEPYKVVEYQHTQMGRAGATVRVKIKNLITGNVLERAYKNDEKINPANVSYRDVSYLYYDDSYIYFMDTNTFDQIRLDKNKFNEIIYLFNEGSIISGLFFKDKLVAFNIPKNVILDVSSTPDGDKGNSSSGATKEAILSTGISLQVPMFIKNGDRVRVDTRDNSYIERILNQ